MQMTEQNIRNMIKPFTYCRICEEVEVLFEQDICRKCLMEERLIDVDLEELIHGLTNPPMNNLLEQINNNIKTAMRSKNVLQLSTLRLTLAAITNLAIDKRINLFNVSEADIISVIRKEIKKRQDTIEAIKGTSRDVGDSQNEIIILNSYLPQQMTQQSVKSLVEAAIYQLGATTRKDMGKVIKAVTESSMGRSDGKTISDCVKELLV